MPPKRTSRGKVARAKKVSRKPARGTVKKAPAKLTYKKTQKFIQKMKKWWAKLDADVRVLEELIQELPLDQPISAKAKREFQNLSKKVRGDTKCSPIPKWGPPSAI